jgi:hypothetical protein
MWGCCYFLSNELGELYVGSSINFAKRLAKHKCFKTINMDGLWYWDYFEEGEYESLKDLRKKEQEYIKQYKDCIVNKTKYGGAKEYNKLNKERIAEWRKNWTENNKEREKQKNKEWRDNNKEQQAEYKKRYYEKQKNKIKT